MSHQRKEKIIIKERENHNDNNKACSEQRSHTYPRLALYAPFAILHKQSGGDQQEQEDDDADLYEHLDIDA